MAERGQEMDPEQTAMVLKSGRRMTVSESLDEMPLGRFHALHLLRMISAWAIFAIAQESTPYMFQGLRLSLHASEDALASFAAAFPLGCACGAALASRTLDRWGRRGTLLTVLPLAGLLSFAATFAQSMEVLSILRTLQAFAFSIAITGMSTWYIEFLPTSTRGMLMAAYSVGWPFGRAVVILVAALVKDRWTDFMRTATFGFAMLFGMLLLADESPRYLVAAGRPADASQVLNRMYFINGQAPSERGVQLVADAGGSETRICDLLFVKHKNLLTFAVLLFVMLSTTTVLLDTWGPHLYHELLSPKSSELPHRLLMLFNAGDLAGVICSIFVIDHIGRSGSFVIGFFVQGFLLVLLTYLASDGGLSFGLAVACGTLSSACRCFAWESAQMWTLEVFPTQIRASAFSVAMTAMRAASIVSLKISAQYMGMLAPATALRALAVMLVAGGFFSTCFLPKETANVPMTELTSQGKSY